MVPANLCSMGGGSVYGILVVRGRGATRMTGCQEQVDAQLAMFAASVAVLHRTGVAARP